MSNHLTVDPNDSKESIPCVMDPHYQKGSLVLHCSIQASRQYVPYLCMHFVESANNERICQIWKETYWRLPGTNNHFSWGRNTLDLGGTGRGK